MTFALDHIVHFIGIDGEKAIFELKKLGVESIAGGVHTDWGTANLLSYAGLSYVEYLFINDKEKAAASTNPLIKLLVNDLQKREGFGQLCFRCEDIKKVKRELSEKGYKTGEVIEGKRRQEDGKLLKWKMLFMKDEPNNRLPWPFFIQWEESDIDRFERLKGIGAISSVNEKRSITAIRMASEDPEYDLAQWKDAFNLYEVQKEKNQFMLDLNGTHLIFEHRKETDLPFARPIAIHFGPALFFNEVLYRGAVYQ